MDVVVVLLDAAAAGHFSFLGYERETTPFLTRLAAESVVFESAYAQASATPLSVYSLFTGELPLVAEMPVLDGELVASIPAAAPTLASLLADRYPARKGLSGNRWIGRELGYANGFSEFTGIWELSADLSRNATLLSDQAVSWLSSRDESSFFLYLHYLEPHLPYAPPEPFASRFDPSFRGHIEATRQALGPWRSTRPNALIERNLIALYDGNLAYVDSEVQRVAEAIEAAGGWDRTIFILLSDHGEAFWQHGVRGHGMSVYEEMVRVPLFVRIPGLAARRIAEPVQLVDLLPTLLELAGADAAKQRRAGQSLVPLFFGDASGEDGRAFSRNHEPGMIEYMLREGRYKWVRPGFDAPPKLYDLLEDPDEARDLQSHRARELKAQTAPIAARFAVRLDSLLQAATFPAAGAVADTLDAAARERLKAMGYFH
jgi:arylsulfatase A-like enzyme